MASLSAADDAHPNNWAFATELTDAAHRTRTPRGRVLGGSSAINGANHIRATRTDVDAWHGWTFDDALPAYIRCEDDHDVTGPGHGNAGPVPVERPTGEFLAGLTTRVVRAAAALGVPAEPDKNGDAPPGVGLVPANVVRGTRVNAAMAYVLPHLDRPNLTVRGETHVARVLLEGDRAVGVETLAASGSRRGRSSSRRARSRARSCCTSGIGPADELRAVGVPVRHDRPGWVTAGATTPRCSWASATRSPCTPRRSRRRPRSTWTRGRSTRPSPPIPAGDLEVLLFCRPFAPGGARHLMCAVQQPDSRGDSVLVSDDPREPPRLHHHYLAGATDRARMRAVVRFATGLLDSDGLARPRSRRHRRRAGRVGRVGADDLVAPVRERRARAGVDPGAVVDPELRVHGVRACGSSTRR